MIAADEAANAHQGHQLHQVHETDDGGYDAAMDRLWKRAMGDVETFFNLLRDEMPNLAILRNMDLFNFEGAYACMWVKQHVQYSWMTSGTLAKPRNPCRAY